MYVVVVQRWYMSDDIPTIIEVYSFKRQITKEKFLKLYPSYKNDIITIEVPIAGE